MIRINLLPKEDRVRRRSFKAPRIGALAPLAVFPVVAAAVGVTGFVERTKLTALRDDVAEVREEVRQLKPQVDRVKQLTAQREELERRLDVIRQLDENRFLSVRVMDDLSRQLPKYLWLDDMNQTGPGRITVSGVTFSNLIVADLMMRLERSSLFADVDLAQTERGTIDGRDVIRFSVTGNITPGEKETPFTAGAYAPEEEY